MQNIWQRMAKRRLQENMNVIWHNYPGIQNVSLPIKMTQSIGGQRRDRRLFQETRAMPLVQPLFTPILKPFLVLMLRFGVPRFAMKFPPDFEFLFPFVQQRSRHRVREAKCDEVRRAFLLPVRKVTTTDSNVRAWIHRVKQRRVFL